jgi:stress-induced morphogen
MPLDPEAITRRIEENIKNVELEIEDIRGDGEQYVLHVKCDEFKELNRIDRHRLVYKALGDVAEDDLSSLYIKTTV